VALCLLTVECVPLHTPTTGRDASYKLNIVAEARSGGQRVGRIIIVTLLWSELMGGYNTPGTMVGRQERKSRS